MKFIGSVADPLRELNPYRELRLKECMGLDCGKSEGLEQLNQKVRQSTFQCSSEVPPGSPSTPSTLGSSTPSTLGSSTPSTLGSSAPGY